MKIFLQILAGILFIILIGLGYFIYRDYQYKTFAKGKAKPIILDTVQVEVSKRIIDTTSKRILLTGDSMSGGLFFRMREICKNNNHKLFLYPWYSSTLIAWGCSDTLNILIRKYNPDIIIFCIGSNELFTSEMKIRERMITKISNIAIDKTMLWIGPPNWAKDKGINDLMMNKLGDSVFFLSKDLEYKRGSDGRHPNKESYKMWADSIASWIQNYSVAPIKFILPDTSKSM